MTAEARRIDPLSAARAGGRFLPLAWREAWPILAIASLAFGLWLNSPRDGLWFAIALATGCIARGALYRVGFGLIVHRGGLHIGHVEWRLAASGLLTAVFFMIIAMLVFVVLLAGAYAVASAGVGFVATAPTTWPAAVDSRGRWALVILAVIGAGALAIAVVRLSLSGAATTALGRVRVLATWALTRGQALRLAAALLILAGAPMALLLGIAGFRAAHPTPGALTLITIVGGAAALGLWLPLRAGFAAHAFGALAPASMSGLGR